MAPCHDSRGNATQQMPTDPSSTVYLFGSPPAMKSGVRAEQANQSISVHLRSLRGRQGQAASPHSSHRTATGQRRNGQAAGLCHRMYKDRDPAGDPWWRTWGQFTNDICQLGPRVPEIVGSRPEEEQTPVHDYYVVGSKLPIHHHFDRDVPVSIIGTDETHPASLLCLEFIPRKVFVTAL